MNSMVSHVKVCFDVVYFLVLMPQSCIVNLVQESTYGHTKAAFRNFVGVDGGIE